jgi:hypothetical protein
MQLTPCSLTHSFAAFAHRARGRERFVDLGGVERALAPRLHHRNHVAHVALHQALHCSLARVAVRNVRGLLAQNLQRTCGERLTGDREIVRCDPRAADGGCRREREREIVGSSEPVRTFPCSFRVAILTSGFMSAVASASDVDALPLLSSDCPLLPLLPLPGPDAADADDALLLPLDAAPDPTPDAAGAVTVFATVFILAL